jgi:predicted methyltransferase
MILFKKERPMKHLLLSLLVVLSLPVLARSAIAVEHVARPAEDIKADERRHPRELLVFSKVKSGDIVVDLFPGKGYFTRLFSDLVGPKGHVIAYVPKELENMKFKPVDAGKTAVAGLKNAELKVTPLMTPPAENVDVIWTSQNYHDLHIKKFVDADIAAYNKLLFNMLKPGGYFIVVDHVAAPAATLAEIENLHRIDPKQARKEIEAAGFVFEDESKILAQPEDHKLNVFDPAIRGKTDQFAYRFVKPKK